MFEKILVVGLTCVDVVNYMDKFPSEDSDNRVTKQIWSLGGNAANNVTVLNQLNSHTVLFSALPTNNPLVEGLLQKNSIRCERCIRRNQNDVPLSTIIVNETSGTRTVLHYRGHMDELSCDEFKKTFPDVFEFSWIHFEGRNFDEVLKMIEYVRAQRGDDHLLPRISVECEKLRPYVTMECAIPLVNVVFVSKDFARCKGFTNKECAVDGIRKLFGVSESTIVCPWAEKGAAGRASESSELISIDAFKSSSPVIDTLGAGDCFIACCIHYLNEGRDLETALKNASRHTGKKVTKRGLLELDLS